MIYFLIKHYQQDAQGQATMNTFNRRRSTNTNSTTPLDLCPLYNCVRHLALYTYRPGIEYNGTEMGHSRFQYSDNAPWWTPHSYQCMESSGLTDTWDEEWPLTAKAWWEISWNCPGLHRGSWWIYENKQLPNRNGMMWPTNTGGNTSTCKCFCFVNVHTAGGLDFHISPVKQMPYFFLYALTNDSRWETVYIA